MQYLFFLSLKNPGHWRSRLQLSFSVVSLQNVPSINFLGPLPPPSDHSLWSPQNRRSADSLWGLSLCWPQLPQTKPQTASPSRPPCADIAANGSLAQNLRASSSCQVSIPCHPTFLPKEKVVHPCPSPTCFTLCSFYLNANMLCCSPLNSPSSQNSPPPTQGLFKDLLPDFTGLSTANCRSRDLPCCVHSCVSDT